ncbi:LysR family transcriptional regulator [Marinobacter sp. X15-166B]|uniref:LysR family transcriptional regulator n=1 Tax=Marinobacter sp. X15-166B TaxID=1897620 RepID=UPI00085BFB4C|nr:LysR family transcriptional regulator [Marinobacter sp. X15-166B]OEY67320.1 LysR family transcriptional regulator [Marinobacter sp. X15-166B]
MVSLISLDALQTLDAIDRRQSFAAAADELHRVPSAVSYTVSKLEEDLGVALFDRSRRKAELTAAGRLVLEQGRHILKASEELTALARQAADGWEAELRICVDSVLNCEPVYDLIAAFQRLQPRTEIRLSEEVLAGSWDALSDDRCDLVIGAEGAPPTPGFALHALGQVDFAFAVAAGHPLTRLPTPLPATAIQDYPTVVVADSSQRLPARSSGLLDGRSRIIVPTIAHKIAVQCKGLGVGYLPRHRISRELADGRLELLTLNAPRPPVDIAAAWTRNNKGKGLKWFVDRLRRMRFDPVRGLLPPPQDTHPE